MKLNRLTLEWVFKAEQDYLSARTSAGSRKMPLHDGACFHGQQSAEKYLKARLQESGLPVPKIHDLGGPVRLLLPVEPLWSALEEPALRLPNFAVRFRYPDENATQEMVRVALIDARAIRREVRAALGLD